MQSAKIRGLDISKLTLGTVQLGMDYGIANKNGKPSLETSFELLQSAVDGGVNSFDTALLYGDSEVVLGKYFSTNPATLKNSVLTTKFKVLADGDLSPKGIEKQIYGYVETSLRQLGLKKIPIYMLHNARDMSIYGSIVLDTMKRLKNEGLIEKAGVSVYLPEEADEMLKLDVFEAIQAPMNIFDRKFIQSGTLKRLHDENIIVFIRSVFHQGLYFMDPEKLTGNLTASADYLKQLALLAQREGMSIAQLAFSYVRDTEGVTSLVVGAETSEQVKENIKLLEGKDISEKTRDEISILFVNIPEYILNPGQWKK